MSSQHQYILILVTILATLLQGACNRSKIASLSAPSPSPTVEVYAQGLIAPIGMTALADGTLVVAEDGTGERAWELR